MTQLILPEEYELWDCYDNRNIESSVLEMKTFKEKDNGNLLLDVLPRSCLGYEFKIEIVSKQYVLSIFFIALIRVLTDFILEIYFTNLILKTVRSRLIFKVHLKCVLSFFAIKSRYESHS